MPWSPPSPAATIDLAGWTVAEHYGDPAAEVAAVHETAGLIDHSHHGRLTIAGPDRAAWLNGLVSNDVEALGEGQGQRALLLTVKGRIACDLRLHALADHLLLETAFDTADGLLRQLRSLILWGNRVTVDDLRPATVQFGLHGPAAAELLERLVGQPVANLPAYGCLAAGDLSVTRVHWTSQPGWEVFAPYDRAEAVWSALAAGARPFGWRAAEILRLEAGRPRWGAELSGDVLPLEAELEEALSHTKGCYPGQEVVARMRDRGHANRLLRALAIDGDTVPPRGAELRPPGGERPVGQITSAACSPTRGVLALGYVRREQAEPGQILEVVLPVGRATRATVGRPG